MEHFSGVKRSPCPVCNGVSVAAVERWMWRREGRRKGESVGMCRREGGRERVGMWRSERVGDEDVKEEKVRMEER